MRTLFLFLIMSFIQVANATCSIAIINDTPNSRYKVITSIVLDKQTGLIWMRCALGQIWNGTDCTGLATTMNWQRALQTAQNTTFAGKNDWRLPNLKELQSLVKNRCHSPAINTIIFPSTINSFFWSSSPCAHNSHSAWFVNFTSGYNSCGDSLHPSYKTSNYAVRLVRAGQ